MTPVSTAVFASLLVLSQKQIADIRYSPLISNASLVASWLANVSALVVTVISLPLVVYEDYTSPVLCLLLTSSILLNTIKRRERLYNSIEEIYESILIIAIGLFWVSPSLTLLVSSLVLATSISAGVSKIKSKIWFGESALGFLMFCTLPSTSRAVVRSLIYLLDKKFIKTKRLWILVSNLTPLLQVLSAIVLLVSAPDTFLFYLSAGFQLLFALALFVISDLSWITSIYACLVALFSSTKIYYFEEIGKWPDTPLLQVVFLCTAFYVLIGYLLVLAPKLIDRISFIRKYRGFFLGLVPFKMFTEIHMVNIITHHFEADQGIRASWINAFDKNGLRSNTQNFNSRHLQALMYPLGDMLVKAFSVRASQSQEFVCCLSDVCKSNSHEMQLTKLAHLVDEVSIVFFQHRFDANSSCYKSTKVARCQFFLRDHQVNVRFKLLDGLLPLARG